jgi:catechol-2,3-dioxygenase
MVIYFDHVSLCATDLNRSISFYAEVLELELLSRKDNGSQAVFRVGDELLVLFCGENYQAVDTSVRGGMHHLAFCLDSEVYDRVLERLKDKDLSFRGPMLNKGAQGEGFATYFRDPDGNELEIKKYE